MEATKEAYRDQVSLPRLEALAADIVFSWRQLTKHRIATAAAVLSLALAVGATIATFRLADAVILRDLPVNEPERLFFIGKGFNDRNGFDYTDTVGSGMFERYRDLVRDKADAMAISVARAPFEVTFAGADSSERVYIQYLSGNVFPIFGLRPAVGRLLDPSDDQTGGAQRAVLSYSFWSSRFGRDPDVVGKTFGLGDGETFGLQDSSRFEIVGVAPKEFTGTGPGEEADIFFTAPGARGRIWLRLKDGVALEDIRHPLQVAYEEENRALISRLPADLPQQVVESTLNRQIILLPAAAGASSLQKGYRQPLVILSFLVALVLLVACVNVANLLSAQAAAREREMALRVALGAGRWRLVQLVLVESAILAGAASVLGAFLAQWAAPLITSMLTVPSEPVRLTLETGWREVAFSVALAALVALLFGLVPALKASSVQPNAALKGDAEPTARRRLMRGLLAAQIGFCVFVLFVAGLFINTFDRLANRPLGFNPEGVALMTVWRSQDQPESMSSEDWRQVAAQIESLPGVESVSWGFPLLSGFKQQLAVRVPGREVGTRQPYFAPVSPGYLETLRIELLAGRDFEMRDEDSGVGIVNESFAQRYFDGEDPVGKTVFVSRPGNEMEPMQIIGYVRDSVYFNLREEMSPVVYVPTTPSRVMNMQVRTAGDPRAFAPILEREIPRIRGGLTTDGIVAHSSVVRELLLRERLLAILSTFFAVVALLLAAIGLYGVLHYSVNQQRREIGIRMALGAQRSHVLLRLAAEVGWTLCLGSAAGVAAGLVGERFVQALLYGVSGREIGTIAVPISALAVVALLAALPAAHRAARVDPAQTLRSE